MGHTFPVENADALEEPDRYRVCSRDELVALLDPGADDVVADFGSGTGFYTDDVAPHVGRLYAVDVQAAMHDRYREKGLPGNVETVTAAVSELPFDADHLDGAYSTMTFHEFADEGLAALREALAPGAPLATVDWSAAGDGERGPPLAERFTLAEARTVLAEAGFEVGTGSERVETFTLLARA
jgi:SAM-dependent methyltransferase